ncbi:ATP-dependent Lon protease [Persephonella hydrogeniphila]|uniref:Lon protease n=1 Tax=Persephonella hydrogeniphila TaxID=198703 RepID=A0A285NQ28_9AQUI|nr:endopeptidase La [Persephonella hydrogeniphila]SNZ11612.1 ATP-dependent Lon protease [Persephonella hydrogeniphila]
MLQPFEEEQIEVPIPEELPLLPVRDLVIFPYMVFPIFVGRPFSIKAIEEAIENHDRYIFLALQKDKDIEEPGGDDLYQIGTVATILRMMRLDDDRIKILVQGVARGKIQELRKESDLYKVKIQVFEEKETYEENIEVEALKHSIRDLIDKAVSLGKQIIPDLLDIIKSVEEPGKLADLVASILDLKSEEAQKILEIVDPLERLRKVHDLLLKEVGLLEIQHKIRTAARESMEKDQREYFLRQQIKAIQEELGERDERQEEIEQYRKKIEESGMPEDVKKEAEKQLKRLEKMHPDSAEAGVIRTYLDWLVELPWNKRTKDKLDLKRAKKILDEDHYDLEKVKERILEYLAVQKLKKDRAIKGPILCFVGPPGVGKTSLGKSIARALGRKFVRQSLGGVRDEAEIRGHRRTYVGALPGRIIQAIKQAGTKNPVLMLDEVDKLASDFRGDPASALLEVLDPEQNKEFVDHYLGVPFDLSEVMFICTANRIDTIPRPLLDRMEVIRIPGYSEEEKLYIAKNYLIPRQLKETGLKPKYVEFTDAGLKFLIRHYTREAGVRSLERQINAVLRKIAKEIALSGKKKKYRITKSLVKKFLGAPLYMPEKEKEDEIGVVTGLAWTEVGGEILKIEATKMPGKGQLILTGSLGDVMKESAMTALSYVKSKAEEYRIDPKDFQKYDVHVHVPAGAIPKDGPSAGISIATAICSLFTQLPVRSDVAMTGEITLRGKVLPVGGLKEKILAAKRAGIKDVILPKDNKDEVMEDIPPFARRDINLIFVEHIDEVFKIAIKDFEKRIKKKRGRKKKD